MEIRVDARFAHPRIRVFQVYRDELTELTDHLPNILSIEVTSRHEQGDGSVELVNEWRGGGDIPAAVRGLLDESLLSWTDYATWHADRWCCEWRNEIHALPGAVRAAGINHYRETGGGTLLEIRGELTCDPAKLAMVPKLLRKTVAGTVEKVLVSKIGPNLRQVAEAVDKLLAQRG